MLSLTSSAGSISAESTRHLLIDLRGVIWMFMKGVNGKLQYNGAYWSTLIDRLVTMQTSTVPSEADFVVA